MILGVDSMSIEGRLNVYLHSSPGKKKIKELAKKSAASGRDFGVGSEKIVYREIIDDLIHCIQDHLPESLRDSALANDSAYKVGYAVVQNDGGVKINISFNEDAVFRPSLDPDGPWGPGVENIVLHLSNGWHASGVVSGQWHGRDCISRRNYEGDNFMKEAIFDFNMSHVGATATLGDQYK